MTLGKMILKRKKAVSPVIATILLIALTVTAAAIVYFVVVPLIRGKPELVILDYGKVSGTNDRYEVEFQNSGGADANINFAMIELVDENSTVLNPVMVYIGLTAQNMSDNYYYVMQSSDSTTLIIDFDNAFIATKAYTIRVLYDNNKALEVSFTY